jgi:hypothetical protein
MYMGQDATNVEHSRYCLVAFGLFKRQRYAHVGVFRWKGKAPERLKCVLHISEWEKGA